MPLDLIQWELWLPRFALVLARVAGLVLAVPMWTSAQIPNVVKAWLVVTLSLMAFPVVAPTVTGSLTLGQAVSGMVGEIVIGELLGLGAGLAFLGAQIAGKIVSHQAGLGLGTVFNPIFDSESTVLDQIWFFSVLVLFLAMRGHLAVIQVLLDSFHQVPPMTMSLDMDVGLFAARMFGEMFELALRLAGPAVLALLLTSLIMGVFTKTMPQLNILSVGFSFKITTAIFMVAMTIIFADDLVESAIFEGLDSVGAMFEHMATQVMHAG